MVSTPPRQVFDGKSSTASYRIRSQILNSARLETLCLTQNVPWWAANRIYGIPHIDVTSQALSYSAMATHSGGKETKQEQRDRPHSQEKRCTH